MKASAVFDQLAGNYDRQFGRTLGQLYRRAVWRHLDRVFQAGQYVLEVSCGTGEDALHLSGRGVRVLATDPSAGMLQVASEKISSASDPVDVELRQLGFEQLGELLPQFSGRFDGAFSNFGGLNFVEDLEPVARSLAGLVRPGGRVVLCVVGRLVPWEWAWFVLRGQPRKAFRRLARGGATWKGVRVRYPSIRQTARAFSRQFHFVGSSGLGALLPPPYAEDWASAHPSLVRALDRWERRLETWPPVAWLADHYVIELERR